METIFLLLSGVILFAGVLYWFWSHLQLTQKKVQLLENAVFELRSMLITHPERRSITPEPVYKDLSDDVDADVDADIDADAEAESETDGWGEKEEESEPEVVAAVVIEKVVDMPDNDDALQPGGRIMASEVEPSGLTLVEELPVATVTSQPAGGPTMLEGMPVRELRRLGEERGIKNAEAMKKKELLAALRMQIDGSSNTLNLVDMGVVVSKEEVTLIEE